MMESFTHVHIARESTTRPAIATAAVASGSIRVSPLVPRKAQASAASAFARASLSPSGSIDRVRSSRGTR